MNEKVTITVTFDMFLLDRCEEHHVNLHVSTRMAGVLVYDRSCMDKTAGIKAINSIIRGLSELEGCSPGRIKSIRYANTPKKAQ